MSSVYSENLVVHVIDIIFVVRCVPSGRVIQHRLDPAALASVACGSTSRYGLSIRVGRKGQSIDPDADENL